MISIQAETARLTTPGMPPEGAKQLTAIGETAREALSEMRRLLGVLRADAEPEPLLAPQPGLADLAELVDGARTSAGGASTRLIVSGQATPLDPGVELTVYRIVQEGLTNSRRHAPGASVDVELEYAETALHVRVRDNGPGLSSTTRPPTVTACSACANAPRWSAASSRSARPARAFSSKPRCRWCAPRDPRPGGRRPGGRPRRLRCPARDPGRLRRRGYGEERRRGGPVVRHRAPRRRDHGCAHAGDGRHRGHAQITEASGLRPDPDADHVRPRRVRLRRAQCRPRAASCSRT